MVLNMGKQDFEKRIKQRKYARRARINKRLMLVSLLILMVTIYLVTPLSRVKTPKIVGNVIYDKNEIIEKSELKSTDFLFSTDYKVAIKKLTSDRFIKSAKIYYDFFSCKIVINEIEFVGYVNDSELGKIYLLSDYSKIYENDLTTKEVLHLEKSQPIVEIDELLLKNETEYNILIYGLSKIDKSARGFIKTISPYQDDLSLLYIELASSDDKKVYLIIENEKIASILSNQNLEYFISNVKDEYECYRYGISENKKDIFIPIKVCREES